jgi:ATP-dependent protease ClpP protease subunit
MNTEPTKPAQEEEEDSRVRQIVDLGSSVVTNDHGTVHCLTVIGQIEGHGQAPSGTKTTKYEHVLPLLASIEESQEVDGLLVLLHTMGGDVEAGLAIAEMIAGMTKPTVTLVLGGGHSIGIPLAVAARHSFIVPTATMTVHPVRHSGMVLGVPQTLRYFEQMQERIVSFVTEHSKITARRFTQLMHNTGELVMDMGTVLDGRQAVEEGLIDELGGLRDALGYLYKEIEK